MGSQPQNLAFGFEQLAGLFLGFVRRHGFDPFVEAVGRNAEALGCFRNGVSAFNDLPDGFCLEFRRESLCAYRLLLCSKRRLEKSTVPGAVEMSLQGV